MILHLEAATCASNVDLDFVYSLALNSPCAHEFSFNARDFGLQCPSCDAPFRFMSGLLQHAETSDCEGLLEETGSLGRFLLYATEVIE